MSWNEEEHSGIPTRAIHEAYLEMQRALKQYRQAKDRGQPDRIDRAHGNVQETVLTFYEMLRPPLKNNTAVDDYWHGKPPKYKHNGTPPDPEDGKAILHIQQKNDIFDTRQLTTQDLETLQDWHDALGLNDKTRIIGVAKGGGSHEIVPAGSALVTYQTYQLGLRNLDSWETKYEETETDFGGFMGGRTKTDYRRARIDIQRLQRASRSLGEVADKLGLHARIDVDTLPVDEL